LIGILLLGSGCGSEAQQESGTALVEKDWETLVEESKGQTLNFTMWQGDPLINAYIKDYVVPQVKELYDINLQVANGQGNLIVQSVMAELQAGKEESEMDMVWINGETFYQLRQIDGLFGPWTDKLPNARYINFENPFIGVDFQQKVDGYECPWGNVQMTIIYDSLKVPEPPRTRQELAAFVKANPGKFTFDNHFTGLTFLKSLLIDIAGGKQSLAGPFDQAKYDQYSKELWAFLNDLKPYLWREGKTFPEAVAPMHQLFASGELWFTMSNNDCEVDNKIRQGFFSETARAYVPDFGSIQNSHYLGIIRQAPNKAATMVVINFMISMEAQLKKADPEVWGDGTILALDQLPEEWRQRFEQIPKPNLCTQAVIDSG
jgi:putative spermidine/putrescine transport system substrate-binding protein